METRLYLIRHAESEGNVNGNFNGWTDLPLTEKGIRQAILLKGFLEDKAIECVYSSPLKRAAKTCQIALPAFISDIHFDERLKEINGGLWEGTRWDVLMRQWEKEYQLWVEVPSRMTMPEGESVKTMYDRSTRAIEEILREQKGRCIAVFTHGTVLRALIAHLLHQDIQALDGIRWHENASVTCIVIDQERTSMAYEGNSSFLDDGTATIRNAKWNK
ncbi:MAG: histidine phosphatase family protein [Clostridia bacterium]